MPLRPCLGVPDYLRSPRAPRCAQLTEGTRCPACQGVVDRANARGKRARRPEMRADQARRAEAVAAWVAERGYWCPGWRRPPHHSEDLTADHVHAVGAGGPERGRLVVLCRSCNSSKGSR